MRKGIRISASSSWLALVFEAFAYLYYSALPASIYALRYVMGSSEECSPLNDDDFEKPIRKEKCFENPKSFTNWTGLPGISDVMKWRWRETDKSCIPTNASELDKHIPVNFLKKFEPTKYSKLYATWLGHATVLVDIEGFKFITDPLWCDRASPLQFAGPKRYRPPPMEIDDLPKLDFAVISHDHYDHLDAATVKKLDKRHGGHIRWFVPLGFESWMKGIGIENTVERPDKVTEMNWGESSNIVINGKQATVWCLPAQHWCQRSAFDRNKRLWCSWAVKTEEKSFYFAGDTGLCEREFEKIGKKLGPFDLAAIPIGAYEPRWFMRPQHVNPEDAVKIHQLIKSKHSIAIHWGTYHMGSYEFYLDPQSELRKLMGNSEPKFDTVQMGQIWEELTNAEKESS